MAAGFQPAAATAWLVEGLLIYLSRAAAVRLLEAVRGLSAPRSRLAEERQVDGHDQLRQRGLALPRMSELAAMWKGGLGEDLAGWLARQGWVTSTHDRAAIGACYGRPGPASDGSGFVTATRP